MKKKIAIFAPYAGLVDRGAETFVIELTKNLSTRYDITLFTMGDLSADYARVEKVAVILPGWLKTYTKVYNALLSACKTGGGKGFFGKFINLALSLILKTVFFIYRILPSEMEQKIFTRNVYRRFIRNGDFDLLFPNNGFWGAHYSAKIRSIKKTPFICTGHGGIGPGEKKILKKRPDAYVAITEEANRWASRYHRKVVTIHNGVDTNRFHPEHPPIALKDAGFLNRPVVLCVAALTAFKRQRLLIEAMRKLGKGSLILIGRGELKNELSETGKNLLGNRFILTDSSYEDMPGYYNACDVFSLPSKNEPLGIVYLEAMASNKPCVAPEDPVRREIIGDTGVLCDVENAQDYAKAIEDCFKKNWNDLPRKRAMKLFSWEAISGSYADLIGSLIKNG